MKSAVPKLRIVHRNLLIHHHSSSPPAIRASTTYAAATTLTDAEAQQINAVVPRLCSSNHLKVAVRLISAALSTDDPPLGSLPLSILTKRLARESDLALPMHFLNFLKHNPSTANPSVILPIVKLLVSSSFRNGRPRTAVKVFQWVSRPDFPGGVAEDPDFYAVLVDGFCKNGMVLDSIRVLRAMAGGNLGIGDEIGEWVYRGLLREARVREASELRAALVSCTPRSDGGILGSKELVGLLDQLILNWAE